MVTLEKIVADLVAEGAAPEAIVDAIRDRLIDEAAVRVTKAYESQLGTARGDLKDRLVAALVEDKTHARRQRGL